MTPVPHDSTPPMDVADALGHVVERFDHVSMAVRDPASLRPLLDLLGAAQVDGGFETASEFHWAQYDLPHWGRLEVISTESDDPEHFINRFIDDRGEGLHHLTFKVSDLAASCDAARDAGYRVVGFDDSVDEWKEAFLHPASSHGVLIQLAEFPDHA